MGTISDSSLTASLVFLKKILHGCVSVRQKLRPQLPENKNNKNVGISDSKTRKLEITNDPEVPDSKWFVQVMRWGLIGVSKRSELEQSSPEPRGSASKNDEKTCDFPPVHDYSIIKQFEEVSLIAAKKAKIKVFCTEQPHPKELVKQRF